MSSSYALALPEARARAPLYGTRAQLAASSGDVEGYLALASCDRQAGTATYALRIVNQSPHPLRARMTCARMRGEPILAYPLDVHVAPFAISETLLPVRVADVGPYQRAIVHVSGGDIAFSLEAPAPASMNRYSRWFVIAGGALLFALASGVGAATATPRISTIAAPARVFPGSSVDVPYAFGGWASMRYALKTRDGRQLTAGLVREHEGTLHFTVPSAAGRDVLLAVNVAGPFGSRSAMQHIAVTPSAPRHTSSAGQSAPRISEFAVITSAVHANGVLKLSYTTTDARDGEIWLIDDAGRLWARAPISSQGETTIAVPQGAAGRSMRAVLHARNNQADAVASIGVTVLPDAMVTRSGGAPVSDAKAPQAALTLSTQNAAPGDMISVRIEGKHGDAQISLNDGAGNSIEQGDMVAGQSALVLTAPNTTTPATFYVMANVTQGVGEQTLVKKLTVTPR